MVNLISLSFLDSSVRKESACNAGDPGSIPGLGRSLGEVIGYPFQYSWASLVAQLVKNLPAIRRPGFDPWVGKIPWRRDRLPTPVFLPGESHGQRSLVGYSLWVHKESDTTEWLNWSGLYNPWNSPGENTGVGSLSLLQGIFPAQGSNPGLPHCRWILYQLSHRRSPRILERVAYSLSSGSSQPRNWTRISWVAGGFFTSWATKKALAL